MAKAQPTRESGREKMTAAVQARIDQADAGAVQTVLVIPRLRAPADADARAACQKILREHFATRPAELLAQATRRYGQGQAFGANLRDSRLEAQRTVISAAASSHSLLRRNCVIAVESGECPLGERMFLKKSRLRGIGATDSLWRLGLG